MSIMAKTPSGYKKIGSAYLGERPVDKVYNANGDVVYALQRELTGVPPLLFKGKEQSELLNYRIYGDTVDGNSVGDLVESGEHEGEYSVPVTVEGKNLFDGNTISAYTEMNSPHRFLLNNGATAIILETTLLPSTVTINAVNGNRCYVSYYNTYPSTGDVAELFITVSLTLPKTITVNTSYKYIMIQVGYQVTVSNIMLNSGSTALPYEPYHAPVTTPIYLPEPIKMVGDEAEYVGYAEQKMHRVRKNLLQNTATSQTKNGVTFTVNADKSITCNGTATNIIFFAVKNDVVLESGTYVLTGCPLDGGQNTFKLYAQNAGGTIFYVDEGAGAIINYKSKITILITILSGYTCNNLTFYPMIRKADIEDNTYEPYIENTDLDVILPALPTIKGTNTMSVDTTVQPSRMDIEGRIKTLT